MINWRMGGGRRDKGVKWWENRERCEGAYEMEREWVGDDPEWDGERGSGFDRIDRSTWRHSNPEGTQWRFHKRGSLRLGPKNYQGSIRFPAGSSTSPYTLSLCLIGQGSSAIRKGANCYVFSRV